MIIPAITLLMSIMLATPDPNALPDDLGHFRPMIGDTSKALLLQDFCIFRYKDYTYLAPMKKQYCNEGILVAKSSDLWSWETLGDAVDKRTPEDKAMVWAPHVVEDDGVYYMFYTGVTEPMPGHWCQRILVADTKDPSKPAAWQCNNDVKFIVDGNSQSWFRPDHPGAVWNDSGWADCRDPMVLKHDGTWYMFYSGTDTDGGIMGVASAPSILGPWKDHGAAMKIGPGIPESCFVLEAPDGTFIMTTNHAHPEKAVGGFKTARAKSLLPSDGKPSFTDIRNLADTKGEPVKGWAHEFIAEPDYHLTCAALGNYDIHFRPAYFRGESYGWAISETPTPDTCEYARSQAAGAPVYLRKKRLIDIKANQNRITISEQDGSSTIDVIASGTGYEIGDLLNVAGVVEGDDPVISARKVTKSAQ